MGTGTCSGLVGSATRSCIGKILHSRAWGEAVECFEASCFPCLTGVLDKRLHGKSV